MKSRRPSAPSRPSKRPHVETGAARKIAPKDSGDSFSLARPFPFPPAWLWLVDELIPTYVKKKFSPRDSWKDKPFTPDDGRFFFRGIEELSELFTEDRPTGGRGLPDYFAHEKFRSAYLLYFLPLQAAKFLSLFHAHPRAVEAALRHGKKTGVMRVADLGAGPGTASLALVLHLLTRAPADLPSKIEFEWLDTSGKILEDGRALMDQLALQFPLMRERITVKTKAAPWWDHARHFQGDYSLVLMGNVLNEAGSAGPDATAPRVKSIFERTRNGGGGVVMLEPAVRKSSHLLSQTRDALIGEEVIEPTATSIWGPCLHAGACPLATGRDWCHFSVPAEFPGRWFKQFSKSLGSERHWLKFSYLWLASPADRAPDSRPEVRRVISDPIRKPGGGGGPGFVLLCEPEQPGRMNVGREEKIFRGDLVTPAL